MGYRIALVGNPNTGKTTLFNRLSGARAKTSNFPGTTTAARIGHATLANGAAPVEAEIVDLPGLYRLGLSTPESTICREVLAGEGLYRKPDAVVVVVDACNLTRNLVLVGELLAYDEPVVVALNMVDLAQRRGLTLDRRGAVAGDRLPGGADRRPPRRGRRSAAPPIVAGVLKRGESHTPLGLAGDQALEAWADKAVAASVTGIGSGGDSLTQRLDEAFTHPILGILVFAGGDGRHVLDAVRAGAAADGPDRSGLRAARRRGSTRRCPPAPSATSPPTASSAASPARRCSCRRSACCSS